MMLSKSIVCFLILLPAFELSAKVVEGNLKPPESFKVSNLKFSLEDGERTFLEADFIAPFYTDAKCATLRVVSPSKSLEDIGKIKVSLAKPGSEGEIIKSFEFELKEGANDLSLDISELHSGRYPVFLQWADKKLMRLLRVERPIVREAIQKDGADLSGSNLIFIDNYHIESMENLGQKMCRPETYEICRLKYKWNRKPVPHVSMMLSGDEKKLVARWSTWNEDLQDYEPGYSVADSSEPDKWQHFKGTYKGKLIPPRDFEANPSALTVKKPSLPIEKCSIRYFEKGRDVLPPVRDIFILCTTKPFDSEIFKTVDGEQLEKRASYAAWEKNKGEIVLLDRKPICDDNALDETYYGWEGEDRTNDNYGGTFLSDDGKTLYYIISRVPFRRKPMTIEYDNLRGCDRIQTVYWTSDGLNWNKQCTFPRSETEEWWMQEYGMVVQRDVRSNLLWAISLRFNVREQRLFFALATSRDFINWRYVENGDTFIGSADMKDWTWGFPWKPLDRQFIVGGKSIRQMHVFSLFHNVWTVFNPSGKFDEAYVRELYKGRDLEKLPLFEEIGGYAGFGDFVRNKQRRSLGVVVYRKDTYGALEAGDEEGVLVTRPMRAKGSMHINAETEKGGFIKVEFLRRDDLPIEGFSKEFSGSDFSYRLFDKLPEGVFKIRITMQKAKLYALELR